MSIEFDGRNPIVESADSSTTPAKLDFAKYRSDELAESIAELISVPGRILRILRSVALVVGLAAVACYLIRAYSELALIPSLLVCAYALTASIYFGSSLGVVRVISHALQNLESILRILLHTTERVAEDCAQARDLKVVLPSSGELVELVYLHVMVPVLERAVRKSFYFLARPMLWCYRRTIGVAVHKLVKRVNQSFFPGERGSSPGVTANLNSIEDYIAGVKLFTARASEITGRLGRRLRTLAMLPLYVMYGISVTVAVAPIAIVLYLFG